MSSLVIELSVVCVILAVISLHLREVCKQLRRLANAMEEPNDDQ